jgi:insulysin
MEVLMALVKEPCYTTLRTQQQLGYIVSSMPSSSFKVIGATIIIQSSKFGAEYLESRINHFLENMTEFNDVQVEKMKAAKIKIFEQVDMNIL